MKRFSKKEILETMENTALVPVFYNADAEVSKQVLRACFEGGVRLFEFTNRGEKAAEVFPEIVKFAKDYPEMIVGAGSISFGRDALKFIRMGANFIVGPQYVPAVARICRLFGVPYVPGCGTVSEVGRAQRAGCEVCKVFPGDVLGPKFVKALKAPMPWSRLMVTGGVKPERENLEGWFKAGAMCVGMGSNLFPKETLAARDWTKVTELCRDALKIINDIKIK